MRQQSGLRPVPHLGLLPLPLLRPIEPTVAQPPCQCFQAGSPSTPSMTLYQKVPEAQEVCWLHDPSLLGWKLLLGSHLCPSPKLL